MDATIFYSYENTKLSYMHAVYNDPIDKYFYSNNHKHNMPELIYFLKGSVTYLIDGQHYKVNPNDIFIVNPEIIHRIVIDKSADYRRQSILLSEDIIPSRVIKSLLENKKFVSQNASYTARNIFRRLDQYCATYDDEALWDIIPALMIELFYNIDAENKNNISATASNYSSFIESLVDYIDNHLSEINDIENICSHAHISKSYLHKLFMEELQVSPMAYVRNKRLELGRKLLRQGLSVLYVYDKCGFSSYAAFYRAYKSFYGYAPSDEIKISLPANK